MSARVGSFQSLSMFLARVRAEIRALSSPTVENRRELEYLSTASNALSRYREEEGDIVPPRTLQEAAGRVTAVGGMPEVGDSGTDV